MARSRRSKNITREICESRPAKRISIYDTKCPGFFVNVYPSGMATFFVKLWNRAAKKQKAQFIGRYHPEHLTVEMARSRANSFKGRNGAGEDVVKTERKKLELASKQAMTVAQVIDRYIDHISEVIESPKKPGFFHARIKTWRNYRGLLNRFLRPALGHRLADEITNDDIQTLLDKVRKGLNGYKGSNANMLAAKDKFSAMFTWALAAGRRYITVHPCRDLQEMPAKGERKRVLNLEEIRIFWHGLDRTDLPFPRGVALGLKFELATMLRSIEFRTAEVAELKGLGTRCAHITVPLERVKKRRVIEQPLSTLAQEIIAEAMRLPGNPDIVFRSVTGIRLSHAALADALNGVKCTRRGKTTRTKGLCEILGLDKFTPHDLRRTAASVARELQCRKADIAACLDHSGKGEEAVSPVSNIYMRRGVVPWSRDLEDKRIVLETLAEGLREAIGLKPPKLWAALNVDLPPLPAELERLVA